MTLTERRKRIRLIREALSMALYYTEPHMRDLERSDHFIGYATVLAENLCGDLVDDSPSGKLHQVAALSQRVRERSRSTYTVPVTRPHIHTPDCKH